MNYHQLEHKEKIHLQMYAEIVDALTTNFNKYPAATMTEGRLVVTHHIADLFRYDSVIQKLGVKIDPIDDGLYAISFEDRETLDLVSSDLLRYIYGDSVVMTESP